MTEPEQYDVYELSTDYNPIRAVILKVDTQDVKVLTMDKVEGAGIEPGMVSWVPQNTLSERLG